MGDKGNSWNRFDRGPGCTPSHPVVKGPPRHLPFQIKWSLPKRSGFSHNRETDVQHVTLVALVRQVAR